METSTEFNTVATLDKVSKNFADVLALNNVSLKIKAGKVLSILGPNGAGKTTLINLLLGRLSVSKGEVQIFSSTPGSLKIKRLCGAMLQISAVPDTLTVREHIELFQSYYPKPMDYQTVIELADLNEVENRRSKILSGGQKQKLLFALAICGNPKLLFLDEPSVGLDVNARKSLWKVIDRLKKQGAAIVLTTHYLEEADQLSDYILMLNKGQIIQQGTPTEIKESVNFKKISFKSIATFECLENIAAVKEVTKVGNYFELQSSDVIETLNQLLVQVKDVTDLTVTAAALEDAFISINNKEITKVNPVKDKAA